MGLSQDPQDVSNLADMIEGYLGDLSDEIPRERLEGLATEILQHYGDDGFDTLARIDAWVGEYLD